MSIHDMGQPPLNALKYIHKETKYADRCKFRLQWAAAISNCTPHSSLKIYIYAITLVNTHNTPMATCPHNSSIKSFSLCSRNVRQDILFNRPLPFANEEHGGLLAQADGSLSSLLTASKFNRLWAKQESGERAVGFKEPKREGGFCQLCTAKLAR